MASISQVENLSIRLSQEGAESLITPPHDISHLVVGSGLHAALYGPSFTALTISRMLPQNLKNLSQGQKPKPLHEYAEQGLEFMRDIGGESFVIELPDNETIEGMFFSHEAYQAKESDAFEKWKTLFTEDEYSWLGEAFEIDRDGEDLSSLLCIPPESKHHGIGPLKVKYAMYCVGASNLYEFNPQMAMFALHRGLNTVLFNYRGINKSKGTAGFKSSCEDAVYVATWLTRRYNIPFNELAIMGCSMGSGPATFAASECHGAHLVIDRGFERMKNVAPRVHLGLFESFKPILPIEWAANQWYPYPNGDLIPKITGEIAIIEAKDDLLMAGEATRLLERVIEYKHQGSSPDSLRSRYVFLVDGDHASIPGKPSWYAHSNSHIAINRLFREKFAI